MVNSVGAWSEAEPPLDRLFGEVLAVDQKVGSERDVAEPSLGVFGVVLHLNQF